MLFQYQKLMSPKSRKESPQILTQLSPRSHPRHHVGKRTTQKYAIKDITSDSQVNSYFQYRRSPASLKINIYFYLFLYLHITRITINNGTPHLKSLKDQNRRAALGRPAIKLLGLQLLSGRTTLALWSALVPQRCCFGIQIFCTLDLTVISRSLSESKISPNTAFVSKHGLYDFT